MKITGVAVMAVAIGTGGAGSVPGPQGQVTVCMAGLSEVGAYSLAQATAAKIFAGIGVKIQWHTASSSSGDTQKRPLMDT